MKTYIINDCEIITNENNLVSFARNLLTGKFIKHSFASNLLKYATGEGTYKADKLEDVDHNHITIDFMMYAIMFVVCLTMVMFFTHLSVIENGIILMLLVVLRMMNVARVKVSHLSNKRWSV